MTTRVLVVDDSPTVRRIVTLSFAGEDAKVEGTASAEDAIGLVRSWNPDVVLAATHLAGCSGYEICRTIKNDPELARIPVILLTGALDSPDDEDATAAGCDGRLAKPLDSLELVRLVQGLVRPHAAVQDRSNKPGVAGGRHFASTRTLDSFLGSARVLDILDPSVLKRPAARPARPVVEPEPVTAPLDAVVPAQATPEAPVDVRDPLDVKLEERIRHLAPAILQELAERIVEETLKRRLDEQSKEPRG